jgi:hypothetical protein
MASGQHEKAEHVLEQIASMNKRALLPGKLVDADAEVSNHIRSQTFRIVMPIHEQ